MNSVGGVSLQSHRRQLKTEISSYEFSRSVAKVVVADIAEDGGHETVEMIESNGGEATFVKTDVTDSEDVAAMVQTALDEYGGLDFAHNNAGIRKKVPILPTTTKRSGTE